MTVDHINIKRPEDPESRLEREITTFPLTLRLSSPRPENIVFSPAHRLLVIAIRREILENIDTLEDLFEGKQHEIMVKLGKQQDIVFFRGMAKGTALDKSKPLTSNALTEYLKRRGRQLGYTKDISMYSIRRRVAMDMVKGADMETARFLLGHTPDSHTLERYYLNWTQSLDLTGHLVDDGVRNERTSSGRADLYFKTLTTIKDCRLITASMLGIEMFLALHDDSGRTSAVIWRWFREWWNVNDRLCPGCGKSIMQFRQFPGMEVTNQDKRNSSLACPRFGFPEATLAWAVPYRAKH